jgi:hypothetical protein
MNVKLFRSAAVIAIGISVGLMPAWSMAASPAHDTAERVSTDHAPAWKLSRGILPVGKDGAIGLKLRGDRIMWVSGTAADAADNNRAFIYDVRTQRFRETAPVPAAKGLDGYAFAGVLPDDSVVIAGGDVRNPANSVLSYRYDPRHDRWTRTGDLPEPYMTGIGPVNLLRDGRLLATGGAGVDWPSTHRGSLKAFVFGAKRSGGGSWDYTRSTKDHRVTTLGRGHIFGHAVRLDDGRVFVAGGHTIWDFEDTDLSALAADTDYFDPATGRWTTGAPLPAVRGEDDLLPGSHGGRANGLGMAVLDNGKVVIAGGATQTDGASFFETWRTRRSILVMTPATNPARSTYRLGPERIPSGAGHGGLLGDDGRGQLLCYPLPGNRVLLGGGQNNAGEDLFDTYYFDSRTGKVTRGPDMLHDTTIWAVQHPEWGWPADYETAVISTRHVSMDNSKLVFNGKTLVHGGGYDGAGDDNFFGSRYVEQLTLGR